jgi:hypothetical protein
VPSTALTPDPSYVWHLFLNPSILHYVEGYLLPFRAAIFALRSANRFSLAASRAAVLFCLVASRSASFLCRAPSRSKTNLSSPESRADSLPSSASHQPHLGRRRRLFFRRPALRYPAKLAARLLLSALLRLVRASSYCLHAHLRPVLRIRHARHLLSPREALYVLDGLLENNTILRLRKHYTDTHGFTEHIFGLCYLLGYSLYAAAARPSRSAPLQDEP